MPYIKPGELLALQQVVVKSVERSTDTDLVNGMRVCPVCGEKGCEKRIARANDVYVHPQDVMQSEDMENPSL